MRKLIFVLVSSFLLLSNLSTNAQDLMKLDNITIVNDDINNVSVQIDVTGQQQNFLNRINETNVNEKIGFNAQLNVNNNLLTLNFTKSFNDNELETLTSLCGFKLNDANFNQLKQLLNQ